MTGKTKTKAKRGRPRADKTVNELQNTQATYQSDNRSPKRPPRVSMVGGLKLAYSNLDKGYHYCWMQDEGGNLDAAIQAYYEFVMEDGNRVTRASGPYPLYLMRLENKYWEEDQRLKHQESVAKLSEQQTLESDEYIPGAESGRKHVLEKDDYDPLA